MQNYIYIILIYIFFMSRAIVQDWANLILLLLYFPFSLPKISHCNVLDKILLRWEREADNTVIFLSLSIVWSCSWWQRELKINFCDRETPHIARPLPPPLNCLYKGEDLNLALWLLLWGKKIKKKNIEIGKWFYI
jgi:hypothetical protein